MKILTFVDLHLSKKMYLKLKKKAKNIDVILCAGDITIFGNGQKFILNKLNKFNKPLFIVHGNHEIPSHLKKSCKSFHYIKFIHKKIVKYDNLIVIGYGGGGFSMIDTKFMKFGKNVLKKMKKLKRKKKVTKIILLTHAPPYKTKLDKIFDNYCGNKSIRKFIEEAKPDYAIGGHFHENFNKKDKIGNTKILNPGPAGQIIRI